jgi:ubiquitin-protein ligase
MQYRNPALHSTPLLEPLPEGHKNTADISVMPEQDGQLAADYRDIKQRFSASPQIKVRAVKGDPPDVYEIDYFLKGLHQEGDGPVIKAELHTVRIDLPYGYPMIPPTCHAVSPIFHPDFAPNNICLGGFWEKTPSLPDLIIHIGRLIAFQLYSREDVYNPKALAWVQANGNLLPLDTTDFSPLAFHAMPREQTVRQGRQEEDHAPRGLAGAPEESFITQMDEPIDDLLNYELPTAEAPRLGQGMRFVVITVISVVLATAAGGFYMWGLWHYDGAIQQWITVGPLLEQGKYQEADQQLQTILARLDKVRLVNKADKLQLLEQINKVRSTEQFRRGLLGYVLFNGHYYSKPEMESFHDIKKRLAKGDAFGSGGRWREAVKEYESASHQTLLLGQWAPVSEDLMRKTLHHARLHEMITVAKQSMAEKDWGAAETQLQKTLRMQAGFRDDLDPRQAEEIETSLRATMAELQKNMGEEAFASGIKQGDQFFAQKQWSQAAASYDGALLVAARSGGEIARRAEKIKPQWRFASFQVSYEQGVAALQSGNWHEAIGHLERSEKLRSKMVATGTEVTVDEKMIRRQILQARISRAEDAAADYLKKKKYGQANKALAEIVAVVGQSGLAAESEFAVAKTAAAKRIANNAALLEIEEQQLYLEKNYKEIFIKYFPSVTNSDLVYPKISFDKRDDSFLYFIMQCRAVRNRQQSMLELDYRYNRTTGRWEGQ